MTVRVWLSRRRVRLRAVPDTGPDGTRFLPAVLDLAAQRPVMTPHRSRPRPAPCRTAFAASSCTAIIRSAAPGTDIPAASAHASTACRSASSELSSNCCSSSSEPALPGAVSPPGPAALAGGPPVTRTSGTSLTGPAHDQSGHDSAVYGGRARQSGPGRSPVTHFRLVIQVAVSGFRAPGGPVGKVMWRQGNGADAGSGPGSDQQNRTRGMIDDEPAGLAQALRAEPGPVAVPGHDEQVRPRRGRHHDPFGATSNIEPIAGPPRLVRPNRPA